MAGTTQTISWNSGGFQTGVRIEYSTNDGLSWIQLNNYPITGISNYSFLVPSGINSTNCRIQISHWNNPNICNFHYGNFTIFDPAVTAKLIGDVDSDGAITLADAVVILKEIVGTTKFTEKQLKAANIDKDGAVTSFDAACILCFCLLGKFAH